MGVLGVGVEVVRACVVCEMCVCVCVERLGVAMYTTMQRTANSLKMEEYNTLEINAGSGLIK